MNAYAKIAIKIVVVLVICGILLIAWNMLGKKAYVGQARRWSNSRDTQNDIAAKLDSLLNYEELLPRIRQVQIQDIQSIRNLIPDADEFMLTSYLRSMHNLLSDNHLETDGIAIGGTRAAIGGTNFEEAFTSDISALQEELATITGAFDMFKERIDEMNNMLVSFQFYEQLGTGAENFEAIVGGIETHNFTLTVRGSYLDIKKFTYDVFNMRPHTALINFQMSPQGGGFGPTRQYSANFLLITYGDANKPPPLWIAWNSGRTNVDGDDEDGEGAEETPAEDVDDETQVDDDSDTQTDDGDSGNQIDEGDVENEETDE